MIKDGHEMLKKIKINLEEEAKLVEEKKQQQSAMFESMVQSNEVQVKRKELRKVEEDEENERIMKYQLDKLKQEEEIRDAKARRKLEKEAEVNKLREQQ